MSGWSFTATTSGGLKPRSPAHNAWPLANLGLSEAHAPRYNLHISSGRLPNVNDEKRG